jgi:hypothetical protein
MKRNGKLFMHEAKDKSVSLSIIYHEMRECREVISFPVVMCSFVISSRTPHRMSTTYRGSPFKKKYLFYLFVYISLEFFGIFVAP